MSSAIKKMIVGAVAGAALGMVADLVGRAMVSSATGRATQAASQVVNQVRGKVSEKASQGRIMLEGKDLSEVVRQAEAAVGERAQAVASEHKNLNGALRGGVNLLAQLAASLAEPSR